VPDGFFHQLLEMLPVARQPLVGSLENHNLVRHHEAVGNAARGQRAAAVKSQQSASGRKSAQLIAGRFGLYDQRHVRQAAPEAVWNFRECALDHTVELLGNHLHLLFYGLSTMAIVIAIDGPAAAGKSTIARRLADRLGFTYIDSGAMYRALALWALREKLDPADMHRMEQLAMAAWIELERGTSRVLLNSEDVTEAIRSVDVSAAASMVAAIPGVRRALVEKQKAIGAQENVVMEGRDIGSVVFPNADLKIFLDAQPEERARRRAAEVNGDRDSVASQIRERDERDRTRAEAPLTQAPDAVYVDSTGKSIEEVEDSILRLVRARITNGKEFS